MDTAHINQTFDLLSLVGSDTVLRRAGRYHIGPCPFCGGRDRFNLKDTGNGYLWYCRICGKGKYHDAIDYVMRRDHLSFVEAVKKMGADDPYGGRSNSHPVAPQGQASIALPPADWQGTALELIDAAGEALLMGPQGEPGRQYLDWRGIATAMWYVNLLGYAAAYDPKLKKERPAIVIPHYDNDYCVSALKMRFIDPAEGGLRYTAREGSRPVLFGLHNAYPHHDTLFLAEGELNAISIMQCNLERVSVLSFGSENITAGQKVLLSRLAERYTRVYLWTDKGKKALEVERAVGRRCVKLHSPYGYDANDLLRKGYLRAFLRAVIPCSSDGSF